MKLLTVSIAAYNVEKYLENTLNSLVVDNDLSKSLEVIIVDDGSIDKTKEISSKFCSLYPDVFKLISKENGGYGSTINASLLIASGKFYKQLDGDDWFDNNNLREFLAFLNECSADLVVSPHVNCYESGRIEKKDDCTSIKDCGIHSISILDQCDCLPMHELTIKTELLRRIKFKITENCFYTDNEYTFFPLLEAKTVAKFCREVYCYRLGLDGQSVSVNGAKKHYRDTKKVAIALYDKYVSMSNVDVENLIRRKLIDITNAVYTYYLVCGSEDAKKELFCFDKLLRNEYPEIYRLSNKVDKIKLLRLSKFCLFSLVKKKVLVDWS